MNIPAGKVYLSPIIDCFDGLAVSWTIGTSPDAELANTMLDDTVNSLAGGKHPIIRSEKAAIIAGQAGALGWTMQD